MIPIPEWLATLADWMIRTSIQGGVLVLLILAMQGILRDRLSPRGRYALWMILLVRLMLPWAPESRLSLYNCIPSSETMASVLTPSPQRPAPEPEKVNSPPQSPPTAQMTAEDRPVAHSSVWTAATTKAREIVITSDIPALAWTAGAAILAVLVLAQTSRLAGVAHRPVTDQRTLELLEDCKDALGVKTYLAVVETPRVMSPSLFGVIRPRLLLPPGAIESLGPNRLRHVFLHELAHLKRNDVLVNWLMAGLLVLHWFNPLIWYGFYRMRLERELACDAMAMARTGSNDEPREYGRTIIHLLEEFSRPRKLPGLVGVLENHNHMKRRIMMISRFNRNAYRWSIPAGVCFLILALVTLTNATTGSSASISAAQAEVMGRVEDFFLHNYRDVTWRKSMEWTDFVTQGDGSHSIAYTYRARIWDRETLLIKEIFTFGKDGQFVSAKKAEGYPKKEQPKVVDTKTKAGMQALVEEFFNHNYRDITARETIEWGDVVIDPAGNSSIRYKFLATIWHKDKKIMNQIFTFTPKGEYVSAKNVEGFPKKQ